MRIRVVDEDGDSIDLDSASRENVYEKFLEGYQRLPDPQVPEDADEMLMDFGGLDHPREKDELGFPKKVTKWSWYQKQFIESKKNIICVKSNKVGMTTGATIDLFMSRLVPQHAGMDALLVAQTQELANEHLLGLKKLVANSRKYSKYMITDNKRMQFKEQKTKLSEMYIENPWNLNQPSRIIALGGSEGSAFSWKNIDQVLMSDISQLSLNDAKLYFGAIFSRLSTSNGIIKIETIPGDIGSEIHRIWENSHGREVEEKTDDAGNVIGKAEDAADVRHTFETIHLTYKDGVAAGITSEEYIEQMRKTLDPFTFDRIYMGRFIQAENAWYNESMLKPTEDYGVGWD